MKHNVIFSIATVLVVALFSLNVEAQDGGGGGAKAGLIYGYSVPDADNTKPRILWGFVGDTLLSVGLRISKINSISSASI